MNNHEREERRKQHERREEDLSLPEYPNRAHRACERECLDLKAHIKALESLLAEAGSALIHANHLIESYSNDKSDAVEEILFRIDAILQATESKKDE